MAKSKTVYVCSNCAYETPKWLGKCPECGEWATLEEEVRQVETTGKNKLAPARNAKSVSAMSL